MAKFLSGNQDVYIEVAERYKRYINAGVLKDGDKLPSVRVAAEELGVNPNTVQKAYTLLERENFIYTIPKKGVFVSYKSENSIESKQRKAEALKEVIKSFGISKEELKLLIEEVCSND